MNDIFVSTAIIYSVLLYSAIAIKFLDFAFGLDYFKKYSITNLEPVVLMPFIYSILVSAVNISAYIFNSEKLLYATSYIIIGMFGMIWLYYTVKYLIIGVLKLRKFCQQKRIKPH